MVSAKQKRNRGTAVTLAAPLILNLDFRSVFLLEANKVSLRSGESGVNPPPPMLVSLALRFILSIFTSNIALQEKKNRASNNSDHATNSNAEPLNSSAFIEYAPSSSRPAVYPPQERGVLP
jgi:hypothetical protein